MHVCTLRTRASAMTVDISPSVERRKRDDLVASATESDKNGRFYHTMPHGLTSVGRNSRYADHQFMSPLAFWKQHGIDLPIMSDMARCFLSASATSVQSESAFSVSAHYARKERSRLSASNLAMSVYLKDKL